MHKHQFIIGLLVAALSLSGCAASKAVKEMEDSNSSFVFGYIDMSDAPTELGMFQLRQVSPKVKKPYWNIRIHDGIFYQENVAPGSYQFSQFGGPGGWFSSASYYYYQFPRQSGGIRISEPGVYFLGSFRYVSTGSFFNRKFEVEKIDSPGPKELMSRLMPYVEGTRWEARLRSGLASRGVQ